jgi:outer membrane biosynthesis protein TonB
VNRDKDILQISKYLKGELDARAMHQLERRALDDPFLADAIEGFEQAKADQKANLDDLSDRLHQRIAQKERRIIPWVPLSIAASILIIIGAGIWFLSGRQPEKTALMAQDIKVEKKQKDTIAASAPIAAVTPKKSDTPIKPTQPVAKSYAKPNVVGSTQKAVVKEADKEVVMAEPPANSDEKAAELYKPKKDSVATNELIVGAMEQKKAASVNSDQLVYKAKQQPATAEETLLKSRADGVSATPADGTGRTITGMVIGSDDRQPIVGATVKVMGRPFGVVTNAEGKFSLQDVGGDQTLSVNYIGYSQKRVKVSNKDSLSISLEPAGSSLNEVVVTGYDTKKNNDGEAADIVDAHPKDGWHSYNQYLKQSATSPDGKTGKVKVSFIVAANGSLSQFKVIKSLSDTADKKAIDLITNGPVWTGSTDGRAKEVKVSISFHQ